MDIVKQIHQICFETNNEWFLTHEFTKVALYDLLNGGIYNENECICLTHDNEECTRCNAEITRTEELDKLNLSKNFDNIYDYNLEEYVKSKWILPDFINDQIPGFILIKSSTDCFGGEEFTHQLVFACVRTKYRNKGILKNMIHCIPQKWNIWLEASSIDIENIEKIWEKCGFLFHQTIHNKHSIYKKISL